MPQLTIYPSLNDLPASLACQAHAFIRITWFDIFQYDLHGAMMPPEWHSTHITISEENILFAHGAVVWKSLHHAGQDYKCYGLSSVFTYPAFRKKGYGSQIAQAATNYIRQDPHADLAILWTSPQLEPFYGQYGWKHMPNTIIQLGDPEHPRPDDGYIMMLFFSEKARTAYDTFIQTPIYFGEGW